MKKLKKMVAVLLTVVMAMAMGVTVFASGQTGTLTVNVTGNNTLEHQTIKLYRLFDLTRDGEHYGYTVNDSYKPILKELLNLNDNSTSDDYYNAVSQKKGNDVQTFADDFEKKALERNVEATNTSGKITSKVDSYEFNNLPYGYYLVYQTGTKDIQPSLISVDSDAVTVDLKGTAPDISKVADKTTVQIGDIVKYTITGTIPDTTGYDQYVYKINDTLSKGLDFVKDDKGAAVDGNTITVTVAFKDKDVTDRSTPPATATINAGDSKKMSLDLSAWVRGNKENADKEFTVTYYAKVNEDAVVTEENNATLIYGDDPDSTTETTPTTAETPTYPLNIKKTDNSATKAMLAGATFRLYKEVKDAKAVNDSAIKVKAKEAGNYVVDTTSSTMDMKSTDQELTTGSGYNLCLNGLAEGTYYLVETQAPEGYNKLADPITVKITKSTTTEKNEWTLEANDDTKTDHIVPVVNSTGTVLPKTGGTGTIIFSIVAGVLILGVAVSFIKDRKKEI